MANYEITKEVDIYGLIDVEGIDATFDVEYAEYIAEPYSWGQSRGVEVACSASLVSVQLGGLEVTRAQALSIFGPDAIERLERVVTDEYVQEQEG